MTNPAEDDFDSRSHLVNMSYDGLPSAKLRAYAYLLDLENAAGEGASNDSFGLSVSGEAAVRKDLRLAYYAEYAYQTDAASSPLDYRADYVHATLSGSLRETTVGAGYEMLGAGDGVGFQTPLATLHKFDGFADVFLKTPTEGLIDRYAWVSLRALLGTRLQVIYHDFSPEDARGDFGTEWDVVLSRKFGKNLEALAKYAGYDSSKDGDARPLGSNIRRVTVQLQYRY